MEENQGVTSFSENISNTVEEIGLSPNKKNRYFLNCPSDAVNPGSEIVYFREEIYFCQAGFGDDGCKENNVSIEGSVGEIEKVRIVRGKGEKTGNEYFGSVRVSWVLKNSRVEAADLLQKMDKRYSHLKTNFSYNKRITQPGGFECKVNGDRFAAVVRADNGVFGDATLSIEIKNLGYSARSPSTIAREGFPTQGSLRRACGGDLPTVDVPM